MTGKGKLILFFALLQALHCAESGYLLKVNQVMKNNIPDRDKAVIAINTFADNSIGTNIYRPWKKGIPTEIMETLGAIPYFKVIARDYMLNKIIKEHEFQLTGLTDQKSTVKLGKMLNAEYMVMGNFMVFQKKLQIRAMLVKVSTSEIVHQASVGGALKNFFLLQKNIAIKLTDGMKIKLTPDVKTKLLQRYGTRNIDASLSNFKGEQKLEELKLTKKLDTKKDPKKTKKEAIKLFKKALEHDKTYKRAKKNLLQLSHAIPMTI